MCVSILSACVLFVRVYCLCVFPLQCELNKNETVMLPSPLCLGMKVSSMYVSILSAFVLLVRGSLKT